MLDGIVNQAIGGGGGAPAPIKEDDLLSNDKIKICVIGVGGGGCNTINRIAKSGMKTATTLAVNTDQLHLKNISADKKVLIGASITKGLGAGGYPEVASKCAEASRDKLREVIGQNELVFLCAGMGGGTGTGASPVIAEIAKDEGAIVVSIVTVPFALERIRLKKAQWGLENLSKVCNTTIIIDNNRLVSYVPNLPINDAFALADNITARAVRGIADTIMLPSLMNIDFADVKSVMDTGGVSLISIGEGRGCDKVDQVVKSTLEHPLLDVSYEGATGALIHIGGSEALSLGDSIEIGERVTETFDAKANVKIGARLSPEYGDLVSTTAIITGIKSPYFLGKPVVEAKPESSMSALGLDRMNYL